DLDHARAAVAHRVHAVLVAKARNFDAFAIGDLDDRFVGPPGHLAPVQLEADQRRFELRQFRPGGCVHGCSPSSWGKYFTTQSTGFGAAWPRPQMEASRITCDSSASSETSQRGCSISSSDLAVPARQGVHCPHDSSRKNRIRLRAAATALSLSDSTMMAAEPMKQPYGWSVSKSSGMSLRPAGRMPPCSFTRPDTENERRPLRPRRPSEVNQSTPFSSRSRTQYSVSKLCSSVGRPNRPTWAT